MSQWRIRKGACPTSYLHAWGQDVLSHYRVLFDFGAKKMYLAPPSAAPLAQVTTPVAQVPTPAPVPPAASLRMDASPPALTHDLTLPYTTNARGAMLVDVTLNNTQKATFILDTATPYGIITTRLAHLLGLPLTDVAVQDDGTPLALNGSTIPASPSLRSD